jgi:hypothetical protein
MSVILLQLRCRSFSRIEQPQKSPAFFNDRDAH